MNKKIIAVLLAVSVFVSVFTIPALAREDVTDKAMQKLYTVLDNTVNALVGGIAIKTISSTRQGITRSGARAMPMLQSLPAKRSAAKATIMWAARSL